LLLGIAVVNAFGQEPIAVAVNSKNPINNISMLDLRDIFECDRTTWASGSRIVMFSRMSNTPEYDVMLKIIYKMSEGDYRQYWVMRQVRGESSCRATELPSKGITMEALRIYPGAIALIRVSDITPEMKVITVEGKKPDSTNYPLR
jgi:ABC-type phosphate transport system substrate-binding protein